MSNNLSKNAVKSLSSDETYRNEIQQSVIMHIASELDGLSSTKNPSILRNIDPEFIQNISIQDIHKELVKRAPIFYKLIKEIINNKTSEVNFVTVSICATILHARNKHLTAFAHKMGLFLRQCGANGTVSLSL